MKVRDKTGRVMTVSSERAAALLRRGEAVPVRDERLERAVAASELELRGPACR